MVMELLTNQFEQMRMTTSCMLATSFPVFQFKQIDPSNGLNITSV